MTTRATLEAMHAQLMAASRLSEVFGVLLGDRKSQKEALGKAYRQLFRICHHDMACTDDKPLAADTFKRLTWLREEAERRIDNGTYDQNLPLLDGDGQTFHYQLNDRLLTLGQQLGVGLYSTVYGGTLEGEKDDLLIKLAHQPTDNPALRKEREVLEAIRRPSHNPARESFFDSHRIYFPKPYGVVVVQAGNLVQKEISVLGRQPGTVYTALELRKRFGGAIEPFHVYWIYRRILLTILMTQMRGFVHGALTPDHLLVYPAEHGFVLLGWCGATKVGQERIRRIDPTYKEYYPAEVFAKEPVNLTTDLYMAGKLVQYLLSANVLGEQFPRLPANVAQVLQATIQQDPKKRPQNLMDHYDRFIEAIEAAHGKRRFTEMLVPSA